MSSMLWMHVDLSHIFLTRIMQLNFVYKVIQHRKAAKNFIVCSDKNIPRIIFPYRPMENRALFRVKWKAAESPLQRKEGKGFVVSVSCSVSASFRSF